MFGEQTFAQLRTGFTHTNTPHCLYTPSPHTLSPFHTCTCTRMHTHCLPTHTLSHICMHACTHTFKQCLSVSSLILFHTYACTHTFKQWLPVSPLILCLSHTHTHAHTYTICTHRETSLLNYKMYRLHT